MRQEAYALFDRMVSVAHEQLLKSAQTREVEVNYKADGTAVTKADKAIGDALVAVAENEGLPAISEESEQNIEIISRGDYLIIDPIDGTLSLLEHLKSASKDNPAINPHLDESYDYALLIGIVEKGKPRFGCCCNYVTREKIYLDAVGDVTRIGTRRKAFNAKFARYADRRSADPLNKKIAADPSVSTYIFGSLGIGSLYSQLNDHDSAVLAHFVQQDGLWDVLPACVAARFTGAAILDGLGKKISFTNYLIIPKGFVLFKGDKFSWIKSELQKK